MGFVFLFVFFSSPAQAGRQGNRCRYLGSGKGRIRPSPRCESRGTLGKFLPASRLGLWHRFAPCLSFPSRSLQYRVGQLYTISKHSHQESEKGEGVEVVKNEPHEDPVHGPGQFTEKRVHLSR